MKTFFSTVLVLFFFFQAAAAWAISLPQTGQTTCWDEAGTVIPCSGTEQDGDTMSGLAWPAPRFADNGDGTLSDSLTGLMWSQNGSLGTATGAGTAGEFTWQEALDFVKDLNNGLYPPYNSGYTDWRLPNSNELGSLINYDAAEPSVWLTANGFVDLTSDIYWSSTTRVYTGHEHEAWGFTMWSATHTAQDKDQSFKLIVVRGISNGPAQVNRTGQQTCYDETGTTINCAGTGQDGELQAGAVWPDPRFTDMGDGTVKDELTGLMWLKEPACLGLQVWNDLPAVKDDFNLNPGNYPCTGYTAAYNDWRIPNINELSSLYDFSQLNPPFPAGHPFLSAGGGYIAYSSTNWAATGSHSFGIYLMEPDITVQYKPTNGMMWLVRDADSGPGPGGSDCAPHATFDSSTNMLTIPFLDVPLVDPITQQEIEGADGVFSCTMEYVPKSGGSFLLKDVTYLPGEVADDCHGKYTYDGTIFLPNVDVQTVIVLPWGNTIPGPVETYEITLKQLLFAPSYFHLSDAVMK